MFKGYMAALAAVLLAFVSLPILGVLSSLGSPDFLMVLFRPELSSALALSLETATASAAACAATGIPLGYLISRSKSKATEVARILVTIPLALPPLIGGALLLNVYGSASPIGSAARGLGLALTQSPLGIVLAQVFVASPFVVLTSAAVFERIDRNYEYASRMLGRGRGETFLRVTLPMAKNGIAAGLVLAWVRALGEFGATVMMAYNPKTVSIQLWEDNAIGGLNLALPGVLLVMVVSFVSLAFWMWISGTGRERTGWGV